MERNVVLTSLQDLSPVMEACIAEGSEVVLTVTGNSMRPYLRHRRDQVVLKKAEKNSLRIGDVPLYRRENGQFVLHRVVGLGASCYTMCGDGQWEKEYGVSAKSVVAIATGFYRRGKLVRCTSLRYRIYVRLWMWLFPFRRLLLKGGSFVWRFGRKIRGIFKKRV